MRNSTRKLGKKTAVLVSLVLLTATTSFVPASAATKPKAGAPCPTLNAKTRIGGDQYLCVKNPRFPKAARSWVWVGCIESHTLYLSAVNRLKALKVELDSAKTKLDELIAEIPAAEAKAKEFDAKILETQPKLAAAKARYDENVAKGSAYAAAATQWKSAVDQYQRAINSFAKAAQSLRGKNSDVETQQKRLEIQSKLVASSEAEIKSSLNNRNQACRKGL